MRGFALRSSARTKRRLIADLELRERQRVAVAVAADHRHARGRPALDRARARGEHHADQRPGALALGQAASASSGIAKARCRPGPARFDRLERRVELREAGRPRSSRAGRCRSRSPIAAARASGSNASGVQRDLFARARERLVGAQRQDAQLLEPRAGREVAAARERGRSTARRAAPNRARGLIAHLARPARAGSADQRRGLRLRVVVVVGHGFRVLSVVDVAELEVRGEPPRFELSTASRPAGRADERARGAPSCARRDVDRRVGAGVEVDDAADVRRVRRAGDVAKARASRPAGAELEVGDRAQDVGLIELEGRERLVVGRSRRSLRDSVYATQPENSPARCVAHEQLAAEHAALAGVLEARADRRGSRRCARRPGPTGACRSPRATSGEPREQLLLDAEAGVQRAAALDARRCRPSGALLDLRRLVIDADAALQASARRGVGHDVPARAEARVERELLGVVGVVGAHAGQQLERGHRRDLEPGVHAGPQQRWRRRRCCATAARSTDRSARRPPGYGRNDASTS